MRIFLTTIIIISIGAALYLTFFARQNDIAPTTVAIAPPAQTALAPTAPPPVQYPVPEPNVSETNPVEPLPDLDQSDGSVEREFNQLVESSQGSDLLLFQTFIRNFVVIVDNLTTDKLPQQYLFFKPPVGQFMVTPGEEELSYVNPANYNRYKPFITLVETVDTDRLVNIYRYLYPLFQQAYEELGYPDRYFNDRLIEVINNMLQAPDVQDSPELEQPSVYYKFTDPELEALPAGQKILIRMGPDNAAIIRARLQDLLRKLTAFYSSD